MVRGVGVDELDSGLEGRESEDGEGKGEVFSCVRGVWGGDGVEVGGEILWGWVDCC